MDETLEQRWRNLHAELDQVSTEVWELARGGWQIQVGRLHVRRRMGSQTFAKLFVLFNLLLGTIGGVLIFQDGSAPELGIALVVGAMFSFGAFLTEVWSLTVEAERSMHRLMFGDDLRERFRALRRRGDALVTEINDISSQESSRIEEDRA